MSSADLATTTTTDDLMTVNVLQQQDTSTQPKQPRLATDVAIASEQEGTDQNQKFDFGRFHLKEVLDSSLKAKYVALLGHFGGDGDSGQQAILLVEKEAFPVEDMQSLIVSPHPLTLIDLAKDGGCSAVVNVMHNDIWHKYRLRLAVQLSFAKATLVYPATDRLVAKYRRRPQHLTEETPDDFRLLTRPALSAAGALHSLAWVRNLLDGSAERDRLVSEDPDPAVGYALHADLKWDGRRVEELYCLATCRREGLGSLRDLTAEHLPLLENVLEGGRKALLEKYGVPPSQLRIFLHYQPSFYHLHVHFTHLAADWPGQLAERAHLLTTVIGNIRLASDYYQRATLTFPVKEGEALFEAYKTRFGLQYC